MRRHLRSLLEMFSVLGPAWSVGRLCAARVCRWICTIANSMCCCCPEENSWSDRQLHSVSRWAGRDRGQNSWKLSIRLLNASLKITSLIFKWPDLNPLDYYVRCTTGTLYTPKPTTIAELKTALLQYGMICCPITFVIGQQLVLYLALLSCSLCYVKLHVVHALLFEQIKKEGRTRQPCDFERDFDFVLLQLADTLNTQFKYREGSWHSLLKRFKCWRKSCAKFDSLLRKTYWIFRTRMHVHLKKWTLKYKQLYLLNRIFYYNKIYRICRLNHPL